jgi:hypothetical protein
MSRQLASGIAGWPKLRTINERASFGWNPRSDAVGWTTTRVA